MNYKKRENQVRNYGNYWIITIVDSISTTSMPVNEFVIYRAKKGYECRETVLVFEGKIPENVELPSNVDFWLMNKSGKKIRKFIEKAEKAARVEGRNIVYHLHHPKSAMLFYGAAIGMGIRKKILFTVHSTYRDREFKYKLSSALCVLMAYRANCVSDSAFLDYSLFVRKVKGKAFTVILNGVDFDRVEKSKVQIDNKERGIKRKRLICVGRMIPIKNHIFLLQLLKYLPDYELVLIGKEDEDGEIRRFVEENNLNSRVIFTGLLERDKVFQWLFRCGIYVSASLVEGMPVSVLEAMSAGMVPVLSDIGPHQEIKRKCDSVNTLSLDVRSWVDMINRLGTMDEEQFAVASEICKNSAKNLYSLDVMHQKYFELYDSMCS